MKHELAKAAQDALLSLLQKRFQQHTQRHAQISWPQVLQRLENNAAAWWSLQQMEDTGGEPDVTGIDETSGAIIFCDCAAETPKGRRSICYDRAALEARKEFKPANSAVDMAAAMGIEMLDEKQYRALQQLGAFDLKTSSWIQTPASIRRLGGALFCDRRYDTVFVYHNGAESYYAARGFRGMLRV